MHLSKILLALRPFPKSIPTQNPGNISVGFELKDSYGTAAISYPNGTHQSIALVEANDDYKTVMRELSLSSSVHTAPPYNGRGDWWSDRLRQFERRWRKKLGFPASPDDGALRSLVKSLKEATEAVVGFELKAASASVPRFPAIYDEDLYDSFDYAGLEYISILNETRYYSSCLLYDSMSAIAGHNLSLCADVEHPWNCWVRGDLADFIYTLDYTRTSVFTHHTSLTYGGPYYGYDHSHWNLDVGSDKQDNYSNPDQYWEQVREIILKPLMEGGVVRRATKIIFVGESADNREFKKRALEVLSEWFQDGLPPVYDEDPVFMQAKAVAEMLRRAKYIPRKEKPDCVAYTNTYTTRQRSGPETQNGEQPMEMEM